jgi:hypothetical protein
LASGKNSRDQGFVVNDDNGETEETISFL